MKKGKNKSGAGMKGRDMFNEGRSASAPVKKPSGYGGLKNSTYVRPQPK